MNKLIPCHLIIKVLRTVIAIIVTTTLTRGNLNASPAQHAVYLAGISVPGIETILAILAAASALWGLYFLRKLRTVNAERETAQQQLKQFNKNLEQTVSERTEKLLATEKHFTQMLDNMLEGVQIHDFNWRYLYVNDAVLKYSQYPREELIGFTLQQKYPGIEKTEAFKAMNRCMIDRVVEKLEIEFDFPNGVKGFYELSIQPVPEGIFVLSVDRSERRREQQKTEKANRLYAFISAINQSIVHSAEEQQLLDKVCSTAIEIGKFKTAWAGMLQTTGKVKIISAQGNEAGLAMLRSFSEQDYTEPALQQTLSAKALKAGRYAVNHDIQNDPAYTQWREAFIEQGVKAAISLPIFKFGKVAGMFTLQSGIRDLFDEEEIKLLEEVAGDISFALENFERDRQKREADTKLLKEEERLKQAQALAHLGNWELDLTTGVALWSDEACRIFGYPITENRQTAKIFYELIHPDDFDYVSKIIKEANATFTNHAFEHRILLKDATVKYIHTERRFEFDENGKAKTLYGITQDITAKKLAEAQREFDSNNLQALINNTGDYMWSVDRDFKLITLNKPFNDLMKYYTGKGLDAGTNMLSVAFNEEQASNYKKHYQRAFAGEAFTVLEYTNAPGEFWTEVSFFPIREGEKIIGSACNSRDVSARIMNEAKLRHSEAQLNEAQAVAGIGSFEMDVASNTITWSKQMYNLLGFKRKEVQPTIQLFISMVHPDDSEYVSKLLSQAIQSLQPGTGNFRLIRKDGALIYAFFQWKLEAGDNNKSPRLYGIMQDVTEQKQAEEKLRKNEAQLNEAQAIAGLGSFEINLTSNKVGWSNEHFNLLGFKLGEVAPSSELFFSMVHPHDIERVSAQFNQTMQAFVPGSSNFRMVKNGGGVIHAFCEWKFEFDDKNKAVRLYGIVQDVTERTKHQEEQELFASIVNSSDDAIVSKSLDGIITSWNHGAEKVLGYTAGEIIGKHISLLIPPHLQGEEKGILEKICNNQPVDHYETERVKKDGKIIYASLTVSPIKNTEGQITGASKILRDITAAKESEILIRELNENLETRVQQRTAQLTEANKALEAFSSTVSHDLRAPVRAVNSFAKIIKKDYGDKLSPEVKELLRYIEDSGNRMAEIIDDLLKLAKYGHADLKVERVDMTQLINGIWLNISRTTPHHATLELSELPKVAADMSLLQQVLVNLLTNAIKYSSKKDKPVVTIWCEQTSAEATFFVKDNGAGFDMKNYGRLFGAFQRLHAVNEFEGTGVGLTLVKRIIEKHGGTVGAHAGVGEGATFYFTLPC